MGQAVDLLSDDRLAMVFRGMGPWGASFRRKIKVLMDGGHMCSRNIHKFRSKKQVNGHKSFKIDGGADERTED